MSFKDYLHEKAEESRHNETLSYLMFLAGTIFFIGGITETLTLPSTPTWFLFIPYQTEPFAGAVLGLSLVICGLTLIVFGVAAGMFYSRDRSWYMEELKKANSVEAAIIGEKSLKTASAGASKKKKVTQPVPS